MVATGTVSPFESVSTLAQVSRDQLDIFNDLFWAFLGLGTIVGVVVVAYIIYNAVKYRVDEEEPAGAYDIEEIEDEETDVARPTLGEIPTGVGKPGGKKLFLSFSISALIVLTLITFAYWNLLLVEGTPDNEDVNDLEIQVIADQFSYTYEYPSGATTDTLYVPTDRVITINATSCHPGECGSPGSGNVWHTWSSPDLKASTDAIPGQYTQTWFQANEVNKTYRVECRELCGGGHTTMHFDDGVVALSDEEFREWCTDEGCMAEDELNTWMNDTGGEN